MTRFVLLSLAIIFIYWLFRRILRSFLEGLRPENRNVRGSGGGGKTEIYRDVQDAEFRDVSDERDPPRK
jgi:hypothetical protein